MSIRKVTFIPNEYYHIYNRGNSKQKIFLDKKDYQRFVDLLYAVNSQEGFNFSDSIKGISVYEHVNNDVHLKYLFSYIHLNPVKLIQKDWKEVGLKQKQKSITYLKSYKYSSFIDYLEENRLENIIVSKSSFPNYFPNKKDFIEEIMTWINYDNTL